MRASFKQFLKEFGAPTGAGSMPNGGQPQAAPQVMSPTAPQQAPAATAQNPQQAQNTARNAQTQQMIDMEEQKLLPLNSQLAKLQQQVLQAQDKINKLKAQLK
jgi:hypothetical protein